MASYLFVSAVQPTICELVVCTAAEPLHLCVTSPSPTTRATAAGAKNDHWVFTVDEPLLAARERHEIRADVMARYAQGAARESRPTTLARPMDCLRSGKRPTAACSFARVHGLDTSQRIDVDGPVWREVVAVADDRGASVIVVGSRGLVVGSRGLSGAREVLERSLSHDLARRAGWPLPIVPPAARHA